LGQETENRKEIRDKRGVKVNRFFDHNMRKRLYLFILVCWMAGVFALLWYPSVYVPETVKKITFYDKAAHIVFFGVMTYLFLAIGIRWRKFKFFWTALFSFTIVTALNIIGEYGQGFVPGRDPSYLDFFAGLTGTLAAIPIAYMLHHSPKKKLLLHVCCAPCATAVREILETGYKLEFFFYNPNIYPQEEYAKRLGEVKKLAKIYGIKLKIGKYDYEAWKKDISGYEDQAEGGKRCEFCIRHRLKEAALSAGKKKIPLFTTTLTISPHKNSLMINRIGDKIGEISGLEFLNKDFKENGGWQRSLIISRELGFYRQKYCGCEFSERARKVLT
jgi:epoxyqueuosine reductase